jgi:hypothetical protein
MRRSGGLHCGATEVAPSSFEIAWAEKGDSQSATEENRVVKSTPAAISAIPIVDRFSIGPGSLWAGFRPLRR